MLNIYPEGCNYICSIISPYFWVYIWAYIFKWCKWYLYLFSRDKNQQPGKSPSPRVIPVDLCLHFAFLNFITLASNYISSYCGCSLGFQDLLYLGPFDMCQWPGPQVYPCRGSVVIASARVMQNYLEYFSFWLGL